MLSLSDLPVLDVPERVEALGEDLAQAGRDLSGTADDVHADWAALAGQYVAPEQELVLTAMDVPRQVAGEFLTKMGTASSALSTYADQLRTLREAKRDLEADIARSHQLWATAEATSSPVEEWHGNVAVTVDNAKDQAEQEAADFELAVLDRMAQLQADLFAAQNACANAIIGIYGGQPFKMVGQAHVDYARLHGMDAETILGGVASEAVGWSQPQAYHHTGTVLERLPGGAWNSVTGFFSDVGDLAGLNGDGAAAASRSGLLQFGGDLLHYDPTGLLSDSERTEEANQRIHGMVSGGWNSLINDPGHFLGGLGPDIAAGAVTAGAGLAVGRGVRTFLSAADGSPLSATLRNLNVPTIRFEPHYAYAGVPGNPGGLGGRFVTGNTTVGALLDKLTMQSRADRGDSGSGGGSGGHHTGGAGGGAPDGKNHTPNNLDEPLVGRYVGDDGHVDIARLKEWMQPKDGLDRTGPDGHLYPSGYRRYGDLSVQQFYDKYIDVDTGDWIYPPEDGFDGPRRPATLEAGAVIDRFGPSERGFYAAPDETSFDARAMPPDKTNFSYGRYRVLKPLDGVLEGRTAAWFEQPGGGIQYKFPDGRDMDWYIDNGYLEAIP